MNTNKESSSFIFALIAEQNIFQTDGISPVINIDINGEIIELLHVQCDSVTHKSRTIIFAVAKTNEAVTLMKDFFSARVYDVFKFRLNTSVLNDAGTETCTQYFNKVIQEVRDIKSLILQCIRIMDMSDIRKPSEDITDEMFYTALADDIIDVLLNKQYGRHNIYNIQFNIAQCNDSYKKCFEFLTEQSGKLFNFYGKILYNNSQNEFIQCRNKMFFIGEMNKNKKCPTKKYIAENESNKIISLMIYCTMNQHGKIEKDICKIHSSEKRHKDCVYEENDRYFKLLNKQIDIANKTHNSSYDLREPLIVAAANLLLIVNKGVIILNGLAARKDLLHNHIGTQVLEHCLYTVNPKPLVAYVPISEECINGFTDVNFFHDSMRACAFFKAVSHDEHSVISLTTSEAILHEESLAVKCIKHIVMNKN